MYSVPLNEKDQDDDESLNEKDLAMCWDLRWQESSHGFRTIGEEPNLLYSHSKVLIMIHLIQACPCGRGIPLNASHTLGKRQKKKN
jgi:hypothetical protein